MRLEYEWRTNGAQSSLTQAAASFAFVLSLGDAFFRRHYIAPPQSTPGYYAGAMDSPAATLARLPPGTRVVVRYRLDGGFTDALGELLARDATSCTIATRRGPAVVPLTEITAVKAVPPPPARRRRAAP